MRQFADKPDQSKWENGDCRKCFMPFTVVPMGLYLRCEKCGWIAGLVYDDEE
jgi:PHP family Zn ribbon phosphoesterase